jgi:N-acetylglucosamine malate deacetylase 1
LRKKNILVVAPHADDEAVGCGGTIARMADDGHYVDVVVVATGGVTHTHTGIESSVRERVDELNRAAEVLGVSDTLLLYPDMDMRMDTVPRIDVVTKIEGVLKKRNYDEVYFPQPGFNHDHTVAFEATFAALRMPTVELAATYEYTFSGWNYYGQSCGAMYVDISDYLDQKLAAMRAYKSQIRDAPHPCSEYAVTALARLRGVECGIFAAEMFNVRRMIK